MTSLLQDGKGFTLIEAILTVVLLSFGLVGGLTLFKNATDNSLVKDYQVVASQLASEKLESILLDKKTLGYNAIIQANYPNENLPAPYQNFTRSVTIQEVQASDLSTAQAGSGYKRIDVHVTWGAQAYQTIIISTVVSNYSG